MYMNNSQNNHKLVRSLRHNLIWASLQYKKGYIQFIPNISTEPLFYVRHYRFDHGLDTLKNDPTIKEKKEYLQNTTLLLRQIVQNKIGLFDLGGHVSHHCLFCKTLVHHSKDPRDLHIFRL